MACNAVSSGSKFLTATLAHLDCQAEHIGSYGYGALADPGSTVSVALTGLLAVFVAIWGYRLMLGYSARARDVVGAVLQVGIVITLATSWPAWRVVAYDVIMKGPTEIAQAIAMSAGISSSESGLYARLQNADDGLLALTTIGTGRLPGSDLRDDFRGIALQDEAGFGWGRLLFLFGTIAPYAIVRLAGGVFLSLAPVFAGFLLFSGSSNLFHGWIRALAFAAFGSLTISLIQGVNLAILEPWIADAMMRRTAGEFAPSAATEMAALSLVFVAITIGTLFLVARVTFYPMFTVRMDAPKESNRKAFVVHPHTAPDGSKASMDPPDRAHEIASSVAKSIRREELEVQAGDKISPRGAMPLSGPNGTQASTNSRSDEQTLGSSYRRNSRRSTALSEQRDRKA